MTVWLLLFIVGVVVLLVWMVDLAPATQIPSRCPSCAKADEELTPGLGVGPTVYWHTERAGRYTCRQCGTVFKNHPNGTFVEDR